MCGLVGFVATNTPNAKQILQGMLSAISYRGPDAQGCHISGDVAFGHQRLAIIDSHGGAQPRKDGATGDILVFNGEIYGYRKHAAYLKRHGYSLKDVSDTEVLFVMIQKLGLEKTLHMIDGMFAFAYKDGATGNIHLVRDRFGEKPLYYHHSSKNPLIFASEIAALREHPALKSVTPDLPAISKFLTFEYVPGNGTVFSGIGKVLPGEIVTLSSGTLGAKSYLTDQTAAAESGELDTIDDAVDALDALFNQSIEDRLIADVTVGVFLSGGIDSSMVAIAASKMAPGIKAFTVKMPYESFDETKYAQEVARHHDLDHQIIDFTDADIQSAFRDVTATMDEPMADASLIPSYLLCREARKSVTVALGGDGADELFGGYINFQAAQFATAMSFIPPQLGTALQSFLKAFPTSGGYMDLNFKLRQLSKGFGRPPVEQNYMWMSSFDEGEKAQVLSPDVNFSLGSRETFEDVYALLDSQHRNVVEVLMHLFEKTYLPSHVLTKMDRASMYNSLEVRSPFLSRGLSDLSRSLPLPWKVSGQKTKVVLKRLAERYMPHALVHRKKHGFAFPISEMMRSTLKNDFEEVLLSPPASLSPLFLHDQVKRLWSEHLSGRQDHHKKLYTLFTLFKSF